MYFLASDEMAGRDSLSPEGRIAAQYIAGFYHRYRLKPVGDGGTYFQNFPMVEAHIDRSASYLRARVSSAPAGGGTSSRDYAFGPDFTMGRQGSAESRSTRRSCSPDMGSPRPNTNTTTSPA